MSCIDIEAMARVAAGESGVVNPGA